MSPPYEFDNRKLHSPTRLPREADFTHVSDMHSTFGNLNVDVDERDAEQSHDEPMEVDDPPEPEGWATVSVRSYSPSPVRPGAETPGAGPSHAAWDLELQRTRHFVGQRRSSQGEHVQETLRVSRSTHAMIRLSSEQKAQEHTSSLRVFSIGPCRVETAQIRQGGSEGVSSSLIAYAPLRE